MCDRDLESSLTISVNWVPLSLDKLGEFSPSGNIRTKKNFTTMRAVALEEKASTQPENRDRVVRTHLEFHEKKAELNPSVEV